MQIVRRAGCHQDSDQEAGEGPDLKGSLKVVSFLVAIVSWNTPCCEVVFLNVGWVFLKAKNEQGSWVNAEPSEGKHQGKDDEKQLVDKA